MPHRDSIIIMLVIIELYGVLILFRHVLIVTEFFNLAPLDLELHTCIQIHLLCVQSAVHHGCPNLPALSVIG